MAAMKAVVVLALSSGLASAAGDRVVERLDVPGYPAIALAARIAGTVLMRVTVKDGAVLDAVAESSAPPLLAHAALENVKTWRITPVEHATFDVTYVYEIAKEEADSPENPHIELRLPHWVKITARPVRPTCSDCAARVDPSQK